MKSVDEGRLVDLLIRWNKAQLRGRPIGPDELCPDDAAMREALRQRIDSLLAIEGTIDSVNAADRGIKVAGSDPSASGLSASEIARSSDDDTSTSNSTVKVVPKGPRSFDRRDAHFFRALLPGPQDLDGLPECLGFWKTRIEERNRDQTFAIGVLYGSSGVGKSSLVKAGLIPSLSKDVISIYVESGSSNVEDRLLKRLRKLCPSIAGDLDLPSTLAALSHSSGSAEAPAQNSTDPTRPIPQEQKILIVLDQFERWLLANKNPDAWPSVELVKALRFCDGQNVQCLLVVRDDFWLATARFLRAFNLRLIDGDNANSLEPMTPDHAKSVLAAFGHVFGALPNDEQQFTADNSKFLQLSINGLQEDGRVIPIRLALFADAMKGRSWIPEILGQVVGAEEIGVSYVEASLGSERSPLIHGKHLKAVCAVLKRLLQDAGTNIVGAPVSYSELLKSSGYHQSLQEFEELLRILDNEFRLITPSDTEVLQDVISPLNSGKELGDIATSDCSGNAQSDLRKSGVDESIFPIDSSLHSYQLTHDILVPSLREWLLRKQSETIRGRAELRLEDRGAQWAARNDSRLLPTIPEFVNIQLFTDHRRWTTTQREMMTRATLWHGVRWLRFITLALLIGFSFQYSANSRSQLQLQTAIEAVQESRPAELYRALDQLKLLPRETALKELAALQKATRGNERLRIAFGLAELGVVDPVFLCAQIDTVPAEEADNFIEALGHARELSLKEIHASALIHRAAMAWLHEGRLALIALYLGENRIASEMCRVDDRTDHVRRTCFIEAMSDWPGDVAKLASVARNTDDRALRSAICLALGAIEHNKISSQARANWIPLLAEWFQFAPDGMTRSAAELAIYHWDLEVPTIEMGTRGNDWQVNSIGLVLNRIPPISRAELVTTELLKARPSTYLLSDREVSISQFRRFLTDSNCPDSEKPKEFPEISEVDPTLPANSVNWYDAVLFCNWLSRAENLIPCYERSESSDSSGTAKWRIIPSGTGYRLPTEVEWEFACRSGTTTTYSCGEGFLLTRFANIVGSGVNPCAIRFPNAWGLFDMHGNVSEWCDAVVSDDKNVDLKNDQRAIRGGSWTSPVLNATSAFRLTSDPAIRMDDVGFRVVLTSPATR